LLFAHSIIKQECFNSPYGTKYFAEYAEEIPNGPTFNVLSDAARDNDVWLIGGTIPEISNGKHYNTCMLFDKNGKFVDKYRKVAFSKYSFRLVMSMLDAPL
jgi:omega-amidase